MAEPATGGTPRRYRWTRLLVVLTLLALLADPVTLRLAAVATVADGLGFDVPRPFAAPVERHALTLGGVAVDRYRPVGAAEAGSGVAATTPLVLLPGATPAGRNDRRVVAIATAFARNDRVVVVPELEVYGEVLVPADVDRIVAVAGQLSAGHERGVVLAGLSFGGSLGLLAAADPMLEDRVRLVATFGAYADLAGVIQAATTGVSLVDGERYPWEPDPRAPGVVREQLLAVLDPPDRSAVAAVLAGDGTAAGLPPALRAVHDLLTDPDPTRTEDHLAAAPATVRTRIGEVSPARAIDHLDVPLVALHAVDDPVIPVGELERLRVRFPATETLRLVTFDHVGLTDGGRWWVTARDLGQTARFVHRILAVG